MTRALAAALVVMGSIPDSDCLFLVIFCDENWLLKFVEKFVTNAYKQKKLEMAEQEKEEKRKDMIEDVMDVTKQKDMSGFYK